MSILSVVVILFGGAALWLLWKSFSKDDINDPKPFFSSTEEDIPDQNPIEPGEVIIPSEMPEKPLPVNCQLAQFQPAPQEFFYVDCCGNPKKGEGFEPWEKRSPVSIDANKPFIGMTLLDVEAEKDC